MRKSIIIPLVIIVVSVGFSQAASVSTVVDVDKSLPSKRLPMVIGWTDGRCGTCHETDVLFSHPVGMVPSRRIPSEFPLENGLMVCTTCHKNEQSADHAAARRDHSKLLRGNGLGAEFCANCHDAGSRRREDQHARMLGKAHIQWPDKGFGAPDNQITVDGNSEKCMSCHDGTVASDAGGHRESSFLANTGGFNGRGGDGHPVGVLYALTLNPNGDGGLNSVGSLDARIRLFDNKVECGSCHTPFGGEKGLLVRENDRSALCLSCHKY